MAQKRGMGLETKMFDLKTCQSSRCAFPKAQQQKGEPAAARGMTAGLHLRGAGDSPLASPVGVAMEETTPGGMPTLLGGKCHELVLN